MQKNSVPISEKFLLTVSEAAKYFGIGENKLRTMISNYGDIPDWALYNGRHLLIKRTKFEKVLLESQSI